MKKRHAWKILLSVVMPALAIILIAGPARTKMLFKDFLEIFVPEYELPDPLVMQDGTRVESADDWYEKRRPEILELFRKEVYGRVPEVPERYYLNKLSTGNPDFSIPAVRWQADLNFSNDSGELSMDVLVYLPANSEKPVPVFLILNFGGNHTISSDPDIWLTKSWVPNNHGNENHRATEKSRPEHGGIPIEKILERGYGLATVYRGDLDPDFDDGFKNGVHGAFDDPGKDRAPDAWGAIGAWAWGLSRAMDFLENLKGVDPQKVVVLGHSRLGKTALWAGAQDERFAIVISNESGCGGAAISRRRVGETVTLINNNFPHWFCKNFKRYNGREDRLPVDQHMLIALIAPRPVYIASAEGDWWSDPRGEFLGALNADPVYRFLGAGGLPASEMPGVDQPVMGTIGYHMRTGGHDLTLYDWERYMDFADMHFKRGEKK